jgi:glycosyltransferase involved in cell wall biosynthesis
LISALVWVPISLVQLVLAGIDGMFVVLGGLIARTLRRGSPVTPDREVWHVVPSLGTGGTQRQVVEYLHRVGPNKVVRLFALHDSNDRFLRELERLRIVPVILARSCRTNLLGRLAVRFLPNTTAMVALYARLRASRPTCLVSWLFQANVVAAPAARLAGVPRIVTSVRNMSSWKSWPGFRRWWYRSADRFAAKLSDVVFANSRAAAVDYIRWTGLSDLEVDVLWNGLDIEALLAAPCADIFQRHGLAEDTPVILTVGRLSVEKDHETLLRALERLVRRTTRWRMLVVGHGVLETRLRRLAVALGLSDRVIFSGRVDDPQSYYRAATLFVLTSRIEGLPNALIEAQAFGVAAVTTDCGGAADVVIHNRTGRVVSVGDADAVAENLEELLRETKARNSMGRAAAREMRKRFHVERMVAAVDALTGNDGASAEGSC